MNLPLTTKFYYSVINSISGPSDYFDKKLLFNYADRGLMTIEDNWYYTKLQKELDDNLFVDMVEFIVAVCHSIDVGDRYECGKYTYHSGAIDEHVPFIYAKPAEVVATPFRLYFYGPKYQIEVSGDNRNICCCYETHRMRNALLNGDEQTIINLLKNTDRPAISF